MKLYSSLTLLILALTGCGLTIFLNTIVDDYETMTFAFLERGRQVYLEQYCGVCHQLSIANTQGTFGPSHDHIGTIAAERIQEDSYTGNATTPATYIRESLLLPRIYYSPGYETTNHQMPSYEHLSPEDITALVYFLASQT